VLSIAKDWLDRPTCVPVGLTKLSSGSVTVPTSAAEVFTGNGDVCIIWVMLGSVRLTYCQFSVASFVPVSEFCTAVHIV